jgi:ligand-binding sensor domain-containing protein/two-component sensor histidine kinase
MKKWLIILLSCIHFCTAAQSQSTSISFRNISINEGLSQSSVVDIAADSVGFLWFATQDGLNRYDGKEFLIFKKNFDDFTTALTSTTGKIAAGNRNDLWIITSGGKLERMNLYDQTTIKVDMLNRVPLPPVSCIYPDRDQIWIGTENDGLFIYNLNTKDLIHHTVESASSSELNSNQIQEIFKDSQGRIWVLTTNGVSVFNGIHKPAVALLNSPGKISKRNISCGSIAEDSKGNVWLGTYGKGVMIKQNRDTSFQTFTGFGATQILPSNLTVFTILADQSGKIWVGTYGQGLYIINPVDSTITHILSDKRKPSSLGYNDVLAIRCDKKGGIWIGTDGGGISYYDRRLNNFTLYSASNVPENVSIDQIRSITTDKQGGIWVGTSNDGLTFIDPERHTAETFHFAPYKQGISNYERIVSLITDQQGDIWVGTQGNGLLIINPETKKITKQFYPDTIAQLRIPDHTIWCMHADKNNNIWIGTRHAGMSLVSKDRGILKSFIHYPGSNNSPSENNVRKIIAINDSVLCIGYEKKGIQFFNTRNHRFSNVPDLESSWRSEVTIKTLYFRHPLLWIGTSGKGIIAYNITTKQVNAITVEHGLPNHTIYGILPDRNGALWISTNKGISRFSPPADLRKVNPSHFTMFSAEDGLQSNEFNTGAYYRSENGQHFFGGIRGLNIFNPEKMITAHEPINTVIIQATINNQPFNGDTNIIYKKTLRLSHNKNSLAFNFAALDFVSANRLNYYYQLSDYEKDWINAGNRNYASYTNLPPGNYMFKVKASNNLESSVDPITTLSIIIDPPFWKTWWFITLSGIAISGILYGLYRYRINQLIALQKVRNRIATDLHDDLGSTLTNISILSELSKKNMQNEEQTKKFLSRISEEVYFSNQALDDIVWSINTSNDTLDQTVARMRRYAAEVFDGANISYSLQLDEKFEQYKLSMDQRRDCFLLFKEAINNIYKHAQANNVSIKVRVERNHLYMEIKDDGKGFDAALVTNRNGIKNMHSRIKKWKGSIEINSEPGKGSSTELRFPL